MRAVELLSGCVSAGVGIDCCGIALQKKVTPEDRQKGEFPKLLSFLEMPCPDLLEG